MTIRRLFRLQKRNKYYFYFNILMAHKLRVPRVFRVP
jgi:hypothetical protein